MYKRNGKNYEKINEILNRERVCNLSMIYDGNPHIVPMIYVYDEEIKALFFHSASSGIKISALKDNNNVAFSIMNHSADKVIDTDGKPCGYGIFYESVVGYGKISFVDSHN